MCSKVVFTYEMDLTEESSKEDKIEFLIECLQELLAMKNYQCIDCRNLEVMHFTEIKETNEVRLKQLFDEAVEIYYQIHGLDNFLEALDNDKRIEYNKLHKEVFG